jgi:ribosomal protein S8
MLPTFYTDIFNINISDKITEIKNLDENTLYQTQLTFANLLKSIMSVYPPYSFIKSFKSAFNGEPIKFGVQQDADEFLSILCDKLENEAKILNKENFLENSFKGKITNEIVSLETEYPYYSQTDESFYSITVDIKNHKTHIGKQPSSMHQLYVVNLCLLMILFIQMQYIAKALVVEDVLLQCLMNV